MGIKKGDLVKVIELMGIDFECGVEFNKTYKVTNVGSNYLLLMQENGN